MLTSFQPFMPGFVLLDVLLEFSREHAVIILQAYRRRLDDESFGKLPCGIVRDWNYGCVANSRVRQKVSFEFSRRNL